MNTSRRFTLRHLAAAASALLLGSAALPAFAQAWPAKPVRIVVPFAPGGSTDVVARMVAQKLSAVWGQTVVVENRAGAGGNVGADVVAKSPGDGYTLLMASGSIAINPHLYKNMAFDTKKDLVPISNVASGPMLVVVPDSSPIKNLKDLIAAAKAKPGGLNFGSAGVGSQVHLAAENLADAAGIDISHVPYKGEAPALSDLIGKQTEFMVGNFTAASALLGNGRLRALAVTGNTRQPQLPDVPTVSESGLPGFRPVRARRHAGRRDRQGAPRHRQGAGRDRDQGALVRAGHEPGGQHARCVRQADGRRAGALGPGRQEPQADTAMMAHPLRASRAPSRGQRQRPGRAGSAAFA